MIGAIIGDIVGSVYEFDNIKTKDFVPFAGHHGNACTFTDDSVMTLAAITGAIAGAYYEVPAAMREKAVQLLGPDLSMILRLFEKRFSDGR